MSGRIASENNAYDFTRRRGIQARTGITVIPVVVHVVYKTPAQNISDAQVQSQIDVLTRDFRRQNSDVSSVPAAFRPLAADARIEFVLATTDPAGNPTTGITRTATQSASFTHDDRVKSNATGGHDAWPADKYLNIWVCPLGAGLLGYAQFPGGPAATDGVVILHSAFGNTGTASAPFELGRTATHEVGHWLNLRHIWGDDGNGCNGSDLVDDTPNQGGANTGKPVFPRVTCNNGPNGDLFMGYMDYVDDASMFMFTAGQVERMQACLDGDRSTIGTTKPGPAVPTLARADLMPTLQFCHNIHWLKFRQDHQAIAIPNFATIKFRDDPLSLKFRDDVKHPAYDKPPFYDVHKAPAADLPGMPSPGPSPWSASGRSTAPFVLATPHHSMAWTRSFPDAALAALANCQARIQAMEQTLAAAAQADTAGDLTPEDRVQVDALFTEYQATVAEYQQFVGGWAPTGDEAL